MTNPASIPLAVIGMGCKLPGADGLDEFWRLVVEGRTAVAELPPDRLDRELYYAPDKGTLGKSYSTLGAIVGDRRFDNRRCPMPPGLEQGVDNAHLLMCQVAADALRDAGIDPQSVPIKNTGVFIGHAQGSELGCKTIYSSYAREAADLVRELDDLKGWSAARLTELIETLTARVRADLPDAAADQPDVACSLVAATITKAFGLTGPSLALNSACASSLQAMLVAARALQLGRCEMAIVGGASDLKGDTLVLFAHAQAMSSQGSRPFDAEADGLIVGEGYGAMVLKTLERALADGDRIRGVIRGLGVSSDGKGKSLWAPRKEGQMLAMQRAHRAGLELGHLDYLEAHATATQLGDATELNTVAEVLEGKLPPGKKIPITSVKANIGHALETAGIAGAIKTLLAFERETIPPAASVRSLNPKIDWQKVPVYVPSQPQPWPRHTDGRPRRAGVNAFGIGGLNMHLVIEEFNESSRKLVEQTRPSARPNGSPSDEGVAVIGLGCVLPGAPSPAGFWDLLLSGRDPKSPVPAERWRRDLADVPKTAADVELRGGFITDFVYDWQLHKIPPRQIAQADPLQFMLLDASDQALKQAGYDKRPFDRERVGVVVGTEFGGDFAFQLQLGLRLPELKLHLRTALAERGLDPAVIAQAEVKFAKALLKRWPALVDETGSFSTSSLASRTAKTWNLMGGAAAIDAGHGSSLSALAMSVDALVAGDVDMMICAAGQRRLGLPEYEGLMLKGLLPENDAEACPLDRRCRGYLPAEGVGVLLLKRLADARRDGDPILGVVRGVGAAHHHDPVEALRLAAQRAHEIAGVGLGSIDLVEVDGSLAGEELANQLAAISSLGNESASTLVSTAVGQIGHAEAAAGAVSLIKTMLQMQHQAVPPTFGLRDAHGNRASGHPMRFVDREAVLADQAGQPSLSFASASFTAVSWRFSSASRSPSSGSGTFIHFDTLACSSALLLRRMPAIA